MSKQDDYRNFMGYLWYLKEDNIYTIGFNEDGLEQIDEISTIELPQESEMVEEDIVCGSLEASDGQLDIYSPVSGKVIEINNSILEDPSLIQEDPYESWLFKVEVDEDSEDEDDEDEDNEDEDDEFADEED